MVTITGNQRLQIIDAQKSTSSTTQDPISRPPRTLLPICLQLNRFQRLALHSGLLSTFCSLIAVSAWRKTGYASTGLESSATPKQEARATLSVNKKYITFLAFLHKNTLTIIEFHKEVEDQVLVHIGPTSSTSYIPQLRGETNHNGLEDLVIKASSEITLPTLYQQLDGSFGWVAPSLIGGHRG